jgi:hypothetical protein
MANAKTKKVTPKTVVLKSNRRVSNGTGTPAGQLTEVLGENGFYELYSENNFTGTARVWIKGYKEGSDEYDFIFTCSTELSKELRDAETEEEFEEIWDSIEFANVTATQAQAKDRNGKVLFDNEGEPRMEDVYYLGFGEDGTDMSTTRREVSGVATAVKKEKKQFSWEDAIAGME